MTTIFRLKSHPSPGRTLLKHLCTVGNACKEKVRFSEKTLDIGTRISSALSDTAYVIGVTHDFAKATSYFQNMLNDRTTKSVYSRHSSLSSLFTYYACTKILPDRNDLQALAYIVVRRHHGNLQNVFGEESNIDNFDLDVLKTQIKDIITIKPDGFSALEELRAIYYELLPQVEVNQFMKIDLENYINKICKALKNTVRRDDLNNYFFSLSLYSALQEADKSDAANITTPPRNKDLALDMVYHYRSRKFNLSSEIARLRNSAFKEVLDAISTANLKNERIFSITLPTGFGKTIAGVASALWIRSQAEETLGYSPRIIYSLPFLSIIDQNAAVLKKIISPSENIDVPSNVLLVHHHLADSAYKISGQDEEESIDYKSSIFLIEGWNSELIITTFVQFFQSIITNKKNMLRKFNNMVGSIIILDEVQAIPTKYWNVVDSALTYLCRKFGCWIILMTATKPSILRESKELANWKKYRYKDRVRYSFRPEQSLEDVVKLMLSKITSKKSVIAILNTIGESKEVYRKVKNELGRVYGESYIDEDGICIYNNLQLLYLSSTVLPKTRFKRISRIKDAKVKTVVVSTQVVEAGVDIDMDYVIRDFAPLDCIVQSAGRCNRNAREDIVGDVTILTLKDDLNAKEYCRYVYDSILLSVTEEVISNLSGSLDEKEMLKQVGNYFDRVFDAKSQEPIVDDMASLRYKKVGEFELIENYESIQVFIEVDEEARQVRIEIENNMVSARINLIPRFKTVLNNNTITVRKPSEIKVAEMLPQITGTEIRYVPMDEFNMWYDSETGLNLQVDTAIERRII